MSGQRPLNLAVLRTSTSCRVGNKVDLVQFSWRSIFFSNIVASHAYSSHSSHDDFSLRHVEGVGWSRLVCRPLFRRCAWDSPLARAGMDPMMLTLLYVFAWFFLINLTPSSKLMDKPKFFTFVLEKLLMYTYVIEGVKYVVRCPSHAD
jgi:hypothetical protein